MSKSGPFWTVTAIAIGAVLILTFSSYSKALKWPNGVLAPLEPVQGETILRPKRWNIEGYLVSALTSYSITARVLSTERYRWTQSAELSPVDFALGWGVMSDTRILKDFSFGQGGRFYSWWVADPPIDLSEVSRHSVNMHIIPADYLMRRKILKVKREDIVTMTGYLVRADRPDGFEWISSLTREDTGNGACEIMLVEEISIRSPS